MASRQHERAKSRTVDGDDYYALLGVPYTATFQEITRAYREKMKRVHPDRKHPEQRAAAEEHAKRLNLAFSTLSKTDSRRAYDAQFKATAVQDQIMNRYVGGFSQMEGVHDPFAEGLRRHASRAERADKRRADRSATFSILVAFGGIALVVIALLLLWAVGSAVFSALT